MGPLWEDPVHDVSTVHDHRAGSASGRSSQSWQCCYGRPGARSARSEPQHQKAARRSCAVARAESTPGDQGRAFGAPGLSPAIQGAAFLGLNGSGLGMIIGSRAVTGWWQAALLGFGTGLVLAGTVELGILGVVSRITGQDRQPREPSIVVQIDGETQTVVQPASPGHSGQPARGSCGSPGAGQQP